MSIISDIASRRRTGGGSWNHRSKEVTELRKSGQPEAAYVLSVERTAEPEADDFDRAAYAWCLIDLLKQNSGDGNRQKLSDYLDQLRRFEVPASDKILAEHREKALALADPYRRAMQTARNLSKQGKHEEAARIYADIHASGNLEPDDRKSWGWELYRLIKGELEGKQDDELSSPIVQRVKRHLNTYLKLDVGGPDLLHSLMLRQALRLTKGDHLKVLPFLRLWNPDQFSDEDFTRQTGKDGKIYPALVEQVIQAAASEAAESDRADDRHFILPLVQDAMKRFSDNIWLKLNLTKLLRGMGRTDEALTLAVEFAREKASEYWAWELIGDLVPNDINLKRSCYAKALSCSQDDDFVGKVRVKFATLLEESHPAEARFEVERMMAHRARTGYQIPREALSLAERLAAISENPTDRTFYGGLSDAAEALLFSHLPWTDACLGDVFNIDARDGQKPRRRRRIYVKGNPFAIELSLPENHLDIRGLPEGTPIKVQYETSKAEPGRATIHRICPRVDGTPMDILASQVGVIDHINREKSLIHVVVARGVDGICPISLYPGKAKIGDAVAVRLAQHHSKSGVRTRIVEIEPTDQAPSSDVCRPFCDATNVTPNGLGFTRGDIFIPPHMITAEGIQAGDLVEGIAIASFDKKRGKWGMKAIQAKSIERNHFDFGNRDDEW
ncbi:DUF7017 domain-containing protein [Actibacterium lipolyticum]|uniref:Uncharacterized protein n=1 Tax=Actibacterium lipolyticum TaxID=1524263 RepID=A0A238L7P8_9RHOB|nr:hypothetical protein [Actibacterium lipolyticum]SMX51038.1 hypothetical protein COL8621_03568 [Actibacterium lipolyticum]